MVHFQLWKVSGCLVSSEWWPIDENKSFEIKAGVGWIWDTGERGLWENQTQKRLNISPWKVKGQAPSRGITGLSSPKFTFILTHILTTVFPLEISKFTVVNVDVKCMKQAQNRHADDFQKVSTNTRILLQRAKNNPSSCVGEMCYFKYKHFW